MIYKTLKKVSDVCQVLDKSKYNPSQTKNGVTFTKNDDGTFTANGTATANIDYRGVSYNAKENIVAGRKYLMRGCPAGGSEDTYYMRLIYLGYDYGNGLIAEVTDSGATYYDIQIIVKAGTVCDNLIFKPQLFDLTEMYGAGNEPTTVEQFRQDFPEELYDYKPYCFVKSYKNCLTCTTKNLFDISKVPTISGELTVKDNSICSYVYPVTTNDANLLSIFKSIKPDTDYTISATNPNYLEAATNQIVLRFSDKTSKSIYSNYSVGFNKVTFSLTQEQINNITDVYFYGRDESRGGPAMWSNIQLEEGSTATEYQPYGYIQSRKKSLICTTKNLWTCDKTMSSAIYNSGTQVFKVLNTGSESCYTLPTPMPPGTAVTITVHCLSGYTKDVVTIGGYHNETGNTSWQCDCTLPVNIDLSGKSFSHTVITTNTLTDFWIFVYGLVPNNLQFKVQLELGDTATEYHPYGYL